MQVAVVLQAVAYGRGKKSWGELTVEDVMKPSGSFPEGTTKAQAEWLMAHPAAISQNGAFKVI